MSHSVILQVLEGEEDTVLALYKLIQQSRSHTNCEILFTRHCNARSFPNWSMGYQGLDSEAEINAIIATLKARRAEQEPLQQIAS
jgi:hypothetical protein